MSGSTVLRFHDYALLQECAYLCNMAVDPSWRKLGVGKLVLDAAEQVMYFTVLLEG